MQQPLTPLELSLSSQDADDDSLTTTIHWLREMDSKLNH